jgi:hypothetical protein
LNCFPKVDSQKTIKSKRMSLSATTESEFARARNDMFALPDDSDEDYDSNAEGASAVGGAGGGGNTSQYGNNNDDMSAMSGMTNDDTTIGNRSHLVSGNESAGENGHEDEGDSDSENMSSHNGGERDSSSEGRNKGSRGGGGRGGGGGGRGGGGLEWTMRTTGGESREGLDSLVRMGSIQADQGW